MADQVGGPDDGHVPSAVRRHAGYVATGWHIVRMRRRSRRETRLDWYGQWRNYVLPGLAALAIGVVAGLLAGVATGSVGSLIVYIVALEYRYRADTRPDDPPREPGPYQ